VPAKRAGEGMWRLLIRLYFGAAAPHPTAFAATFSPWEKDRQSPTLEPYVLPQSSFVAIRAPSASDSSFSTPPAGRSPTSRRRCQSRNPCRR